MRDLAEIIEALIDISETSKDPFADALLEILAQLGEIGWMLREIRHND